MSTILAMILKAFSDSIIEGLVEAFKDWRASMAQRDLGAAQQKQADSEAAQKAEAEANVIVLEPRDRAKTKRRMEDGTF